MFFRYDSQSAENLPGADASDSPEGWDDVRRAGLVSQIADARLSVEAASERYGLGSGVVHDWLRNYRRSTLLAFDESLRRRLVEQGANEALLGCAEITGTLQQISIFDVIQSVEVLGKPALITVTHFGRASRIWCSGGTVVDAQSGPLRAEAALYRIASFEHGRVVADLQGATRERKIFGSTPRLLLEAAHRNDESVRLWRRLGDGRQAYRATPRATTMSLSSAERALLASFGEARDLRAVVEQSALGDLETLTMLVHLNDSQFIQADPAHELSATARDSGDTIASSLTLPAARVSSARPLTSAWVAGALGVVALGAALLVAEPWRWLGSNEPSPSVAAAPARLEEPAAATPTALETPRAQASTYAVTARVEPPSAELWLDGQRVVGARLSARLPKDGNSHELRVVAPGYLPQVLLFADTPPPSEIRLEPLPAPAVPPPVRAEGSVARVVPPPRQPVAPQRRAPRVQAIEAEAPRIQVIE